ncbi:hypothetical protein HY837_01550 [archaeon]|nr:hypothetical protein [archaeon]
MTTKIENFNIVYDLCLEKIISVYDQEIFEKKENKIKQHLPKLELQKNPQEVPKEQFPCLVSIVRGQNRRIRTKKSRSNKFKSSRNLFYSDEIPIFFGTGWNPDRVMRNVPLYLSEEEIKEILHSQDYSFLPENLVRTLEKGLLRTSGVKQTDYSVLMSSTEEKYPEGRTGILLYKEKPVRVTINGKEFLVEIKGVGCPDGNNERTNAMSRSDYFGQGRERYGSLDQSEGMREFENLELQRKTSTFEAGEAIRVAACFVYKNNVDYGVTSDRQDQAYVIRLTPSNVRSSFRNNSVFPKLSKVRLEKLARSVGKHYAELAKLEEIILHSNIQPENLVWTGKSYVLTDFADCRRLKEIKDPHNFLEKVLEKIREVPGITESEANMFYSTIAEELGVNWDQSTGYKGFITSVWGEFFAPKVYAQRKGRSTPARKQVSAAKSLLKNRYVDKKDLPYLFIEGAKRFLEEEIDLLQHISTPEAQESLEIAKARIDYLTTQTEDNKDIKEKFEKDPDSYYQLFFLPYMNKECRGKK